MNYILVLVFMRTKNCEKCNNSYSILYRIQYKLPKKWIFACENCLIRVKKDNQNYVYGGTWKG
jgi:hypothetical protein